MTPRTSTPRRPHRIVSVLLVTLAILVVPQAAAATPLASQPTAAAPSAPLPMADGDPTANLAGGFFDFIELTDSNGISVNTYVLSIDEGGVVLSADKMFWATQAQYAWSNYRTVVALSLWVLNWVMTGDWIATLSSPITHVGQVLQDLVDRVGLATLFLAITALVSLFGLYRGHITARLWDLMVALVIGGFMTTALYAPTALISGENGLVAKTFAASQEITVPTTTLHSEAPTDQAGQVTAMVDVLIATPIRIINFGQADLGECETVYVDALRSATWGAEDKIRDAVGDCNDDLGDYADTPSIAMVSDAAGVYLGAAAALILTLAIAGAVLYAGVATMAHSIKLVVVILTGLLPGAARGPIAMTIASIIIDLGIVFFSSGFLAILLELLRAFIADSPPDQQARRMVLFAILLIVGVALFLRYRRALSRSRATLASWLRWSPQGGPRATAAPVRRDLLADAYHLRALLRGLHARRPAPLPVVRRTVGASESAGPLHVGPTTFRVVQAPAGRIGPARQLTGAPGFRQPAAPVRRQIEPPPTSPGASASPTPPGTPPDSGRPGPGVGGAAAEVVRPVIVRVGANAALAAATGGASTALRAGVAAHRLGRVAGSVRRTMLGQQLGVRA